MSINVRGTGYSTECSRAVTIEKRNQYSKRLFKIYLYI